jgi:hypothetical protein
MALSDADRRYVQYMTGIGITEAVFTNTQLDEWYTEAGDDKKALILTVWYALLADASRLYDYRLAQSAESKSQIYKNIKDQISIWEQKANQAQQVRLVGMRGIPPIDRESPSS